MSYKLIYEPNFVCNNYERSLTKKFNCEIGKYNACLYPHEQLFFSMIIAMKIIKSAFPSGRIGSIYSEHLFARIRGEGSHDQKIDAFNEAFKRIVFIDSLK